MVDWSYYNGERFQRIMDQYLPDTGEGETMASQIVTAVTKLVYKWYNDGDVYDNTYSLSGWWNDLSTYANWLYNYMDEETGDILCGIEDCHNDSDYEDLLRKLADHLLDEEDLEKEAQFPADGSIYNEHDGPFYFEEQEEDEEEEWW